MLAYGLPAVCIVLLLKEAAIPIPIPGDVILLGAAARAALGQWKEFLDEIALRLQSAQYRPL
jgi:membrane protein DedA with SNARE-associated domain